MIDEEMKALTLSTFGSPEVLDYDTVPTPVLNESEVLVEMKAIGLNYDDIYRRKGNYPLKGTPSYFTGYEGAGVVVKSQSLKYDTGERVAFLDVPFANAEFVAVPESHVIPLGEHISFSLAASVLRHGLTAQYLSTDSHHVQPGETVLIHAASGGVGQILTQLCKRKGAKVIGLTRSRDKVATILGNNADHAVVLDDRWKSRVMEVTGYRGVDVVYDSTGSTLGDSFDVTRERGHVVFYGMAGGDPEAVDLKILMDKSKTLTGGNLRSYLATAEERKKRAGQLFDWIQNGDIKIRKAPTFRLYEGSRTHRYIKTGESFR